MMETDTFLKAVRVTPSLASEWFDNRRHNRNTSPSRVENFANQMLSGEWVAGVVKPILFDTQGRLANGLHRIRAVIRAGQKDPAFPGVWMHIMDDVDDNTIIKTDDGARVQSVTDTIQMKYGSSPTEARILKHSVVAIFTTENNNAQMSFHLYEKMLANLGRETVAFSRRLGRPLKLTSGVRGAMCYLYPADPINVEAFAQDFVRGLTKGASSSTVDALIQAIRRGTKGTSPVRVRYKMTLHALTKYINTANFGAPPIQLIRETADGIKEAQRLRQQQGLPVRITPDNYQPK
jgi:hypothetical protein